MVTASIRKNSFRDQTLRAVSRTGAIQHPRLTLRPLVAALAALGLAQPIYAQQLPQGPAVVNGSANISTNGSQMTITNSPNAILNWQIFSIGAQNGVRFQQENSVSQVLNRVTGNDPSQILGSLSSNGRVWLINPNGVLFGQNARIDVAGMVASTLDIANADFLAGRYNFVAANGPNRGEVMNKGEIRTTFGGRVWLLGEQVKNEGLVEAPGGQIILAAGKSIDLIDSGMPNVIVRVTAPENEAINLCTLVATGGSVDLHAGIVNQSGIVRATGVATDANGRISLKAMTDVTLADGSKTQANSVNVTAGNTLNNRGEVSGKDISLSGNQVLQQGVVKAPGGNVTLIARKGTYLDGSVDVSNPDGRGGNIKLATGKLEGMAGGTLNADGQQGGQVHVEGRGMIAFSSTLSATGKDQGGTIEVTGDKVYLLNADVNASGGNRGGTVHLGGGWQGSGDLSHANEVMVGLGSEVKANGAKGGEIAVWSTKSSEHYGSLQTKGGGRIELSSKGVIRQTGDLQTGPGGTVLFDPKNLIITDTPPDSLALARKVTTGSVDSAQPALIDGDFLGSAVSLDGDRLAVGAHGDNTGDFQAGAVHLFTGVVSGPGVEFSGLTWRKKLASGTGAFNMPSLSGNDFFGTSISLKGDLLAVGAPFDDTGGTDRGAVHLFNGVGGDFAGLTWQRKLASGIGASVMPALANSDDFGRAVALDGDRLAVGASVDDTGGPGRGAVHLFTGVGADFSGLTWKKKLASDTGATNMTALSDLDEFGYSLALNGDRLAIGAPLDNTSGTDRGAVHVFNGVGLDFSQLTWQGKIASGAGAVGMPALSNGDNFGNAIALDGSMMVVGAHLDDSGGRDRGAVHAFTLGGSDFSEIDWQRKISSGAGAIGMPTLAEGDAFGWSVALDGDRLVVGARSDATGGTSRGAVHTFVGVGTDFSTLNRVSKLASGTGTISMPSLSDGDHFGSSVALDGDRLAIGAFQDATGGSARGAVHLFSGVGANYSGLTWRKKLASGTGTIGMPGLSNGDFFGSAIALDGDRLAVGAPGDGAGEAGQGAVHLFNGVGEDFLGLTWRRKVASGTGAIGMPTLSSSDNFGYSVALDADHLVVGATGDSSTGSSRGAVHLFSGVGVDFSGLSWRGKLTSGTGAANMPVLRDDGLFGLAVALDGNRLAVGAQTDTVGHLGSGAVHLFTDIGIDYSGLTWRKQIATGIGDSGMPFLSEFDVFGSSIALDGDRLVVGAPFDDSGGHDRGAAYVFTGVGTDFSGLTFHTKLMSGSGGTPELQDNSLFGNAVALNGDRLAVGAFRDDTGGVDRGAVYLFTGLTGLGSGTIGVSDATFAFNPSSTSYITPASIEALLSLGTGVTLQANNDITVLSPIVANEGGSGGDFTLRAGRNIGFSASITTDNGNLTAIAGDSGANIAFRDPGTPTLTIDSGVTLNVGLGTATLAAVGGNFVNNNGNSAITNDPDGGRWLIYAENPATSTEGFTSFNKHYNQAFIPSRDPNYTDGRSNWFLYSLSPTLSVTPSSHTITYGATTPGFTPSLTGFIDGDTAEGAGLSGTSIWNVGGSISSSGNSSAGAHDVSYSSGLLSSLGYQVTDNAVSSNELTVNAKALTVLAFTALNKVYDGTTLAAVSGGALSGLISGDVVNLTGGTGTFDTKSVGVNKTVTISGGTLSGADGGNYTVGGISDTTTADITARNLTASYTGSNKTYDSTIAAIVSGSSSDVISGDSVTFSQTAAFANKNAGTGKTINVNGIAIAGADAGNYTLQNTMTTTTADINAKSLSVSAFTASNKVYDGTVAATLSGGTLSGVIAGDAVSLSGVAGAFDNKNVGTGKTVAISSGSLIGADAGNYTLGSTSGTTTADITSRSLTASYTGNNKVYDGILAAGVTGSSTNIVAGDVVNFSQTATFTNKNVGTGKAINVNGIALIGADAGNYSLSGTSATASANITAKNLGVGAFAAQDKVYDATTAATVTGGLLSGVIAGDAVGLTGITGSFNNKNVGTNKTVTVSGGSLSGADAANYVLGSTSGATTADITPKTLIASAITALDKVYDGSIFATLSGGSLPGVISGDTVRLAGVSGSFDSKNVGTNKTVTISGGALSGSDAGNYSLGATGGSTTADITPKNLTVSARTAQDKVYDGTTAATLNGGALSGAITGDAVSLSGVSGNFDTKNVGVNKTVSISSGTLGGLDAGNYTLGSTGATTTADITAKSLTASGLLAADKVYDSTTIASVSGGTLSGVILGDAVNISGATGAFDNKNVGVNKSVIVTGVSLTGADAGNYTVASTTASTADITPATLTYVADPIQGITAPPSTGLTGKVTGFKGSDTLVTDTTGAPAWSTTATPGAPRGSYSVEGSGLTASNYVFVQAPGNSTALTLLAPDTPDLPEQQARNNAISSIENTVRNIDPAQLTGDRSMRLLAVALGAPGNRISDLSDAPGFGSVDLSSMSRDQMTQLISLRREFKKKLFADAIYKLEVDPSLAEVPECANAVVADSGLCRLTDAQRREVVAKVAQANPANTALKIKVSTLPDIQRKIVIAFGIDKYADQEIQPLDNAVLDAKAVSKAFAESLGYEVRVIENPTKADIIRTLNQLSTEIQKNDSLIVYYAGHGFKLDETGLGYWIPSDGSAEDPKNWISNADVSKMLASIGANQVAVISDSCYSGAFTKEKKLEFTTQEVKPDEVLTKRSVVVMSSGGDEPVVDAGGKGGHSIFAAQLMETIQEVDKWQAGKDVFTVVQEAVHKKFPQQPQYGAAVSAGHQAGGDYLFEYRQLEAK